MESASTDGMVIHAREYKNENEIVDDNDNDNDVNSSNSEVPDWLDCSKLESQFRLGRKALGLMFNASSVTCSKTYLCYAWSKIPEFYHVSRYKGCC